MESLTNLDKFAQDMGFRLDTEEERGAIKRLRDYLVMVFGTDTEGMRQWLHSGLTPLSGKSPMDTIERQNIEPVIKVLRHILEQDSRIG